MAHAPIFRLEQPQSLTTMVIERLREAIIDGQFALGENISEDRLASAFGVSRSPVRDALNALQFTGLVEVRSKRGSFVFNPTVEEVAELCDFRFMLEREAARLSRARAGDRLVADLERLTSVMQRAEDAGDQRGYARADTAYHNAFIDHCGNRLVSDAYRLAEARIATLRTVLTVPFDERRRSSFDEHRLMVDQLRRGAMAAFEATLDDHIARTRHVAVAQLATRMEDPK